MSRGPLKGAMSAKKALQGAQTEMRELMGGMEEKIDSPMRVTDFHAGQIKELRKETKKMS